MPPFACSTIAHSAFAMLGLNCLLASSAFAEPPEAPWHRRPLRIVQTLLREPDVVGYDVDGVMRFVRESRANCLVINGGGIIDFFRYDSEMANPNPFLEDRDILAELSEACHKEGIKLLARVDFRGAEEARFRKHPDWFAAGPDGEPKPLQNGLRPTCFNGGYRNEYGIGLIRHLLETYRMDGVWYNSVHSRGACYCAVCQEKYRAATGESIPVLPDADDAFLGPEMARYRALKAQWGLEHLDRVRQAIKAFGDDRVLVGEVFGMFGVSVPLTGGIDVYTVSPYFDFLIGKAFLDDGQYPFLAGSTIRFLKALDPEKQAVLLTGAHRNSDRQIFEPPLELEGWLWEAIANGGSIWNALIAGSHPETFLDRRNPLATRIPFDFLARREQASMGMKPSADVKVYYSGATRERFSGGFAAAIQGAERVLLQRHIPLGFLTDNNFTDESLTGVRALVLPSAAALSDAEIERIRAFVREGGGLVADFQTSLFDEQGQSRGGFGLADVFGCDTAGEIKTTDRNFYQRIRRRHPVLASAGDTDILLNGARTLLCEIGADSGAQAICSYIGPIKSQPPERSWIGDADTDHPTIVVNAYGKGRVVYFANEIMRLCLEDGHPDFSDVLGDAIQFAIGGPPRIETDAPPSVHLALLENGAGAYALSLVNHTSAPWRPVRYRAPLEDITIRLDLGDRSLSDFEIWAADGPIQVERIDRCARIRVQRLQTFSSIAIYTKQNAP